MVSKVTPGVFIQPVSEKKEAMERVCLILDPLFLQGTHVTSPCISLARPLAWPHLDVREAETDVVIFQQQFYAAAEACPLEPVLLNKKTPMHSNEGPVKTKINKIRTVVQQKPTQYCKK